jgi:hypothetical protein
MVSCSSSPAGTSSQQRCGGSHVLAARGALHAPRRCPRSPGLAFLRGPGSGLTAVAFADGSELPCRGLLAAVAGRNMSQREPAQRSRRCLLGSGNGTQQRRNSWNRGSPTRPTNRGVNTSSTPSECESCVGARSECDRGAEIGRDRPDLPRATQLVAVQQPASSSPGHALAPPLEPMGGGRARQAPMTVDTTRALVGPAGSARTLQRRTMT